MAPGGPAPRCWRGRCRRDSRKAGWLTRAMMRHRLLGGVEDVAFEPVERLDARVKPGAGGALGHRWCASTRRSSSSAVGPAPVKRRAAGGTGRTASPRRGPVAQSTSHFRWSRPAARAAAIVGDRAVGGVGDQADRGDAEALVGDAYARASVVRRVAAEHRDLDPVVAGRLDRFEEMGGASSVTCRVQSSRLKPIFIAVSAMPSMRRFAASSVPPPAKSSKAFSVTRMMCWRDEFGAFARAVLGMLEAAFPFDHRPAGEVVGGQLGEDRAEVDLAVAERAEAAGALHPGARSRSRRPAGRSG